MKGQQDAVQEVLAALFQMLEEAKHVLYPDFLAVVLDLLVDLQYLLLVLLVPGDALLLLAVVTQNGLEQQGVVGVDLLDLRALAHCLK